MGMLPPQVSAPTQQQQQPHIPGRPDYQRMQVGTMSGAPQQDGTIPNPNYATQAPNDGLASALQGATNPNNPMQPFYLQNPTMGQATYSNVDTSPAAAIAQILQGFAPQAARSTNALNNTLAAMGVVGGGAADAQTMLQGNLASSLAPTLASAIQGSQGMSLQQALSNANASNAMTSQNLQNLNQQQAFNVNAANNAQSQLAQALLGAWGQEFGAFNNTNLAGLGGIQSTLGQGLSGANSLASQQANNFPVYQSMWPSMFQLGGQLASAGAFG